MRPSATSFKLAEDAYNRSKYSQEPKDVLYNVRPEDGGKHYTDAGILALRVEQLHDETVVTGFLPGWYTVEGLDDVGKIYSVLLHERLFLS